MNVMHIDPSILQSKTFLILIQEWLYLCFSELNQAELDLALITAAEQGNNADALKLLRKGANPNRADHVGYSSLHYAVKRGDIILIEHLVKYGADIEKEGILYGYKPLHLIVYTQNRMECLEKLMKYNVELKSTDCMGNTLLQLMVKQQPNCVEFINHLIFLGMDPNTVDIIGNNCMHNLASNHFGDVRNIETLADIFIQKGIDIHRKNGTANETPLHTACRRGKSYLVDILLREGAEMDAIDKNGFTAFDHVRNTDETTTDVLRVLTKHLVLRLHMSESINRTVIQKIEYNEEQKALYHDFEEDLKSLKVEVMESHHVTYYDILCKTNRKVMKYFRNSDLEIEVSRYEDININYRKEFHYKLKEVKEMTKSTEKAYRVVDYIFNSTLPHLCIEKISSYLNTGDLQCWNFLDAEI